MDECIKSVHYLGSKARMLTQIKECINDLNTNNGRVCDLFCGSAVVSEFLLNYYDVTAVDIQNYSKVYCEARLTEGCKEIDVDYIVQNIQESKSRQQNLLDFFPILEYENECMAELKNGNLLPIYEIIEKGSFYSFIEKLEYSKTSLSQGLETVFRKTEASIYARKKSLDTIITRYYGGLYFSFKQAIDIDSIADYAFMQNEPLKSKVLAALMSATTDVVNTIGKQFAQPLKVKNKDGSLKKALVHKIIADRSMDVFEQFSKWLHYYIDRPHNNHKFNVICSDYVEALKNFKPGDIEVIYADPPYTRYHYSRYYHILETICLHDNPTISTTFPNGKGGVSRAIYRNDRHQSPFCIKSEVSGAFEQLFKYAREAQTSLVLSYSSYDKDSGATPRLLSIDEIINLAENYYKKVEIISPGKFMHSRFNRQDNNYEINREAETLIMFRK